MNNIFNPKVSIIIPVYNGEKYLKQAIDSALNQTYENIEVIIVNDGSKDNTESIIKSFGNKVKYIKKDNGGVSTALNIGINHMTGDFFSWLSHDDLYKPDKIEKQIKYLNDINEKKVILYSDFDLIDKDGELIGQEIKNHNELLSKPEYALLTGAINGITLLIPKEAFSDCGMFDEKLYCTQDYDMWLKMSKTYKFIHQAEILASSRLHLNQETNQNPKVLSEGNELWIKIMENFDKESKIRLEGSEYKFYLKMYNYLKDSQYYGACKYAKVQGKKLKEDKDYNKNDFKQQYTIKKAIRKVNTFFKLLKNNPAKLKVIINTKIRRKG